MDALEWFADRSVFTHATTFLTVGGVAAQLIYFFTQEDETMPNKKELTPIQCAALKIAGSKIAKDEEWRDKLNIGDAQPVDVTLRIRGMIKVAADRPSKPGTARLKPEVDKVLALMLDRLGNGTGRRVLEQIVDEWAAAGGMPDPSESATQQIEASLAAMTQSIPTDNPGARGSVGGQLNIEIATPAAASTSTGRKVKVD